MTALTCARADLAWAIRAVLPHVLREKHMLPQLEGVRLEVAAASRLLYLAATDRYTMGVARVAITGEDIEPGETVLHADDCRDMLRRLRGKGGAELEIYEDGETALDWRVRYPAVDGRFPEWRGLLGGALARPRVLPSATFGYRPGLMARFAPVSDGPLMIVPARWTATTQITVVLSESFAGAIMPVRMSGGQLDGFPYFDPRAALARWRDLLPAEKETVS